MADAIIAHLRLSLPAEVAAIVEEHLKNLEQGNFNDLLSSRQAQKLFGKVIDDDSEKVAYDGSVAWNDYLFERLGKLLADRSKPDNPIVYLCIGYASLLAFVQASITGPPLDFDPASIIFPDDLAASVERRQAIHQDLLASLSVDSIAAYRLIPNLELLTIADVILTSPVVVKGVSVSRWAQLRLQFVHQRLLPETSTTLQEQIYENLDFIDHFTSDDDQRHRSDFLLERAAIHLHHGLDKLAQADIEAAKAERHFSFALTGLLGKRTKFQDKDISQLVVLAQSHNQHANGESAATRADKTQAAKPTQLDLNDDTLLESITFAEKPTDQTALGVQITDNLPSELRNLDPANQPQLEPLDSALLLLLASSITNTSPQHGLTREETLPYATRVLEGGSSNWQVYTQALLVRSRIEGYKSRTVERGLLQLQALVDQVIADTGTISSSANSTEQTSTFLPRAKEGESAPASERLRYIFQLATPNRWELEVELASRWVSLGGLRSALDIYERLEMWAEAALCWAATEREDKARRVVRKQLFHATNSGPDEPETDVTEDEEWLGPARDPPPADAPRLYCILGDIDSSVSMYETAWRVSNQRYARAQRSLGRHYIAQRDFLHAAEAYSKSLRINQLNHSSWFALGCALLELAEYAKAVEAFSRCVQLDESDAEAWSNLGAAILRTESDDPSSTSDRQNTRLEALRALKRAAALKRDSHRIWENVLTVSASLTPPDYPTTLSAQQRLVALRGSTDGEACLDATILERLVAHVIESSGGEGYDAAKPGLTRMMVKFVDEDVVPLITGSARLWYLVGKVALWRGKPGAALDAEEKGWRVVVGQPGWKERWN